MKSPDGPDPGRRDMWLLPAIPVGAAGAALLVEELLRATGVREELPSSQPHALAAAVALVPAWMITAACFRQKHTYDAGIYDRRPGCIVPAWIFFLSIMMVLVGCVLGAPSVAALQAVIQAGRGAHWILGAAVLAAGLGALVVSVSALSRALWLWGMRRHVDQLATSTVRGAAHGLVELRGAARPLEPLAEGREIFGHTPGDMTSVRPFILEDATGRVRVDPPRMEASGDPRIALKLHSLYGLPVLMPGDEVIVVGSLTADPGRPEEKVIRPWSPSSLPFGTRVLSRPDVFLLVSGDEKRAKARLFRTRVGWLLLGVALTLGSLVVTAVGAASLALPDWISGFRTFAR